ncbi:MAG: hypothetical protein J7L32_07215 [Thermoplasmata archaeon]|nr:hypothetical protein [Thermoplasmata archaeon]RLF28054.1 MAG: hypothetical protein DRN01_00815 [Thermoplasmata archaeon]
MLDEIVEEFNRYRSPRLQPELFSLMTKGVWSSSPVISVTPGGRLLIALMMGDVGMNDMIEDVKEFGDTLTVVFVVE